MSWTFDIDLEQEVDAPQQVVWDRVSDHEGTPSWMKRWVQTVIIRQPGETEKNGVGAIRGLKVAGWVESLERVVLFEAPNRFQYKLISGMPHVSDHLGELSVSPIDEKRSKLRWKIHLEFNPWHPLSLSAPAFVRLFAWLIRGGFETLRQEYAAEAVAEGAVGA